jgi:hypothetical protein
VTQQASGTASALDKSMRHLLLGTALAIVASILATIACSGRSASSGETTESVQQGITCKDGAGICGPGDCGMHTDCDEPVYCGGCPVGEVCSFTTGTCCKARRTCRPHACGTFDDGCGGTFCCGSADSCCN